MENDGSTKGAPAHSDFDRIEEALDRGGSAGALRVLAEALERDRRHPQLFEALLMQSRAALGLPLVPLGPASELPEDVLRPHEEAIAQACRKVGGFYLEEGDIVAAWPYFRALGENAPVAAAFEKVEPGHKRKDLEELIDIAFYQGVHPRRGLELILANSGICSSITAMERMQPGARDVHETCAKVLVQALYRDLVASVKADIARREQRGPDAPALPDSLTELGASRPWLLEDGAYHVDPSHLWSIVRISAALQSGLEIERAIELAEYGCRLAPMYHYQSDPPFESFYADHVIYLQGRRAGRPQDNERAVQHFRDKARAAWARGDREYPLGAVLEALVRLNRPREAVDLALELDPEGRLAGTPPLSEMCQRAGDFARLAEVSRKRGDLLGFAAGLVQERRPSIEG